MARSFLDDLRPASFRGVPFKVSNHQYTGGRRVTFHEFPDRNDPYPEDLGKVGKTFKVTGYLIGDDVADQKRKMIEATEIKGPGELVHPYFGVMQVQSGAFSIDESITEGRTVQITFQFYEAGSNKYPNNFEDKQAVLEEKADLALVASKDSFDNSFSVSKLPGFGVDTARSGVEQAADAFGTATKGFATKSEEISALAFGLRNLKAEAGDLIKSPAALSKRIQDSYTLLNNALGGDRAGFQAASVLSTFSVSSTSAPYDTPTRQREAKNKFVFENFMKTNATLNAIKVASTIQFESDEEVVEARDKLVSQLEEQILITEDDTVFQTLSEVKAQLVKVLPDIDNQLPNIQTIKPVATTSAIALSYDLFENVDSESDLIKRNKIQHPGFVVGGVELKVIDVRTST
jgi:prophage DNA circulation protein